MIRGCVAVLLLSVCCSVLSGCMASAVVDSVNAVVMSDSEKESRLRTEVRGFHDALYWGDRQKALVYLEVGDARLRDQIIKASDREKIRVVDSKIDDLTFDPETNSAMVRVKVRYFKVPYYLVTNRVDREKWQFARSSGWALIDREEEILRQ